MSHRDSDDDLPPHATEDDYHGNDEYYGNDYDNRGDVRQNDKVVLVTDDMDHKESRGGGCLNCCARVPCASLVAWIILVVGLGAFCASFYIGVLRTRELLDHSALLPYADLILIGIAAVTFPFATLFLVVGFLSSGRTPRDILASTSKNVCARTLNAIMLFICIILHIAWLLILCLMVVPNTTVLLLWYIKEVRNNGTTCINLDNYGIGFNNNTVSSRELCGPNLDSFWKSLINTWMCWAACFLAAFIVILALIDFTICIAGNYKHLKELRKSSYHVYSEDLHRGGKAGSDDSLPLETKL